MNVTLYGPPRYLPDGKIQQYKIEVTAKQPVSHYRAYKYFSLELGIHLARNKKATRFDNFDFIENLVRARRCISFADSSGLQPQKNISPESQEILKRLSALCNFDHISVWCSSVGTMFVLDEPYVMIKDVSYVLELNDFSCIKLPTNLSPYCGGWSDQIGAKPYSSSYLICKSDSKHELLNIHTKLEAAVLSTPPWNDTLGVSNV